MSDPSGIRADPMLSVELQCARSECALAQAIYLVNRRITIVARRLRGWVQQGRLSVRGYWIVEQRKRPAEAGLFVVVPPYCRCIAVG